MPSRRLPPPRRRRNPDGDAPSPRRRLPVVAAHIEGTREDVGAKLARVTTRLEIAPMEAPRIVLSKPITLAGRAWTSAALFSATTKMNCASLSLPAGPPSQGGTCPASAAVPRDRRADEWVCHGCYAAAGNYGLPSVQIAQAVRLKWVKETLAAGSFVGEMVRALGRYRAFPCSASGFQNPAFFRLHDSGDFFSVEYARAWAEVAARLPEMVFWAPTREWVFHARLPALAGVPSNLVIRPSALFVDEPPPLVPGLAAGSSVMREPLPGVWECPAYAVAGKSCESAGCRTCWTRPEVPVNYHPHGGIKKTKPGSAKVRRNPAAVPLLTMWRKHLARRRPDWKEPQAPGLDNFWITLAQEGCRASDFPESAWFALFEAHGIAEVDDQADRLSQMAFALS